MTETLLTTPLYDEHIRLGGRMTAFAGYSLPVHYASGIREEHRSVREAAGLFDVSHMGEIQVSGPQALDLVQHLTANDAGSLSTGQAQYSLLCTEDGGVVDDLLVYRLEGDVYLLVVNAATRRKDLEWIGSRREGFDAEIEDRSEQYALLALQGPKAASILARRTRADLEAIRPFRFAPAKISGTDLVLARTGYTGEDGFELFVDSERARNVWVELLDAGSDLGLRPAGLGARDILRLEMGYALYGADLDEDHTALEAGLGWVVKLDKGDFVGRAALSRQREAGVSRRLVGIQMSERGFPRPGYPVTVGGEVVGAVTSGTVSPSLECGIAMAYVPVGVADPGTSLAVRIRDRDLAGVVVKLPFYTGGSRKR